MSEELRVNSGERKMVKLGEVCEIINGYAFKSNNYTVSGIRIMRITNVKKGKIIDEDTKFYSKSEYNNIKEYILRENDILISLTGNVGRVGILTKELLPAALNQRVACLRIKNENKLVINYIFQYLNSDKFENACIKDSKGVAQKNMSTEWLKLFEIPLPPLAEQQRIAATLDWVQMIIDAKKQQLDKLDLLVKARFVEMFGDPVRNEKSWTMATLGEIADIRIGPFGTLLHKEDYIVDGHPLINPSHIVGGKIQVDSRLTVSKEKYEELSAYRLYVDDIILGRRGEMGRCAVVKEEGMLCGTGSIIIRPREVVKAYFLKNIISSPSYKKLIKDKAVGGTMMNLNIPIVSSLIFPVLPIDLQKQFIVFSENVDKVRFEISKSLEQTEKLYKALMQRYFE